MTLMYLGVGAALWLLGLHGLLVQRHVLRQIIAINIMGSGVFMVMVALATRPDALAEAESPDPILHALVVTGLVVAVSATAFALRLAVHVMQPRRQSSSKSSPAVEPKR